jgi:hypothetical protein
MTMHFFSVANTQGLAADIVSGIGSNFDGLMIIVGLVVAVPLLFYISQQIVNLFVHQPRRHLDVTSSEDEGKDRNLLDNYYRFTPEGKERHIS